MQDVVFVLAWYVADVAYATYAVMGMIRDCRAIAQATQKRHNERVCIKNGVQLFLELTTLIALALSPIYAIPIALSIVLRISWLLTVGLILNAGIILIGETLAYPLMVTTPPHVSPSQSP
jgi:hypothetical protein